MRLGYSVRTRLPFRKNLHVLYARVEHALPTSLPLSVSLSLFDDRNTKMSAADRAKARREAILKRGQDRLAKLTTSARGEDHPAYRDDLASMLILFFLERFIWF